MTPNTTNDKRNAMDIVGACAYADLESRIERQQHLLFDSVSGVDIGRRRYDLLGARVSMNRNVAHFHPEGQ
jgi:hypothetical protein